MRWTTFVPAAFQGAASTSFLLACILALGAWTRLSGLDLGWFLQDQARDATIALGIASGRGFPLIGPDAGGMLHLGPLFYYLLAIPYGLSADPQVAIAFQRLLNLLAIYLAYHLGKAMFGPPVGLVGAALFAVFPNAVLNGKSLWNPGFIPIFTTSFLVALWHWLVGPRPWLIALVLPLLAVLLQIHASMMIFVVLLLAALLLYRPPFSRLALLIGLLCIALLYAPQLLFEIQHGFPDVRNLLMWVRNTLTTYDAPPFWLTTWRGLSTAFLLPERLASALPEGPPPGVFPVIQRAEVVLLGLGLLALGVRLVKAKDRRPYLLLALWFALPFLVFPRLKVGLMWYYFDVLYPAQFLIIGLLAQSWLDIWPEPYSRWHPQHWLRHAIYALACAIIAIQVWFTMRFDSAVERLGVLWVTEDVILTRAPGLKGVGEAIPLRFEVALAERFLGEFGADHATLEQTAHGAVYQQFREDKGFSFLIASLRRRPAPLDSGLHYVLLRCPVNVAPEQGREVRSRPYRIIAYRPAIRYESWKWSAHLTPAWWEEAFDDAAWRSTHLPSRQVPDRAAHGPIPAVHWRGKTVAFRGWMVAPSAPSRLWLIINIRSYLLLPPTVDVLYLNGRSIELARTSSYGTFTASNIEVMADVTSALRPGPNLVAFQITGPTDVFDLDVYELRSTSDLEEEVR